MGFLNFAMLIGLAAVAIPPIIHLLNRRRYEVVDWGAMQFLQVSEVTRRRLLIEELLLMLLRMGLIAVLVLALADPYSDQSFLSTGQRPERDVVLVLDSSASMGFRGPDGKSARERMKDWIGTFLDGLAPGDSVAVVLAREQPVLLVPKLSRDLRRVREQVQEMPLPSGSADLPRAVQAAYSILDEGTRGEREIIVLGDGQRFGRADPRALLGWEDLAGKRDDETGIRPTLWSVNVDPQRPSNPSNWALAPLVASRAVVAAGQELTVRTALRLTGPTKYEPPHEIRVEVDGQLAFKIDPPKEASLEGGQVPLRFELLLPDPGSHLVSVIVEPNPPREDRKEGYVLKDQLPADNRRDLAVEVVHALPVLIVDGRRKDSDDREFRSGNFLRSSLAQKRDTAPVVKVDMVTVEEFNVAHLRNDPAGGKGNAIRPRVLILDDVPRLNPVQQQAVEDFLRDGGGVLVTSGGRADAKWYNDHAHRDGKGWLPARLGEQLGDGSSIEKAARPVRESFRHPALEMFRRPGVGGIDVAWFARWWRLVPPKDARGGVMIARLDLAEAPFLVERDFGEGRVILSAVPLEPSWRTNLIDLPGYVPLLHELVYYLAAARSAEYNLDPGRPLRYRLPARSGADGLKLQAPSDAEPKPLVVGAEDDAKTYSARLVEQAQGPLLIHEGLVETGVWRLTTRDGTRVRYVVRPDPGESDLAPCEDADREKVAKQVAFRYEDDAGKLLANLSSAGTRQFFWWWFLLGVVLLLCGEVWLTRRIVKGRA